MRLSSWTASRRRSPPDRLPRLRRAGRRGFTLIEAAFVTMVIGFGVVATLQLLAAGTVSNAAGNELTTAVQLANNVREISLGLAFYDPQSPTQWVSREATVAAYDNLLDLDGQAFDPPLNGARTPIASMATWAQKVDVQPVSETNYATAVPRTTSVRTARVTVTIEHNKKVVYQTAWIACAPNAD